jgi:hypothetical protein
LVADRAFPTTEDLAMRRICWLPVLILFVVSCATAQNLVYDFEAGSEGWLGDFADYPLTDSLRFELSFNRTSLPPPLNATRYALRISGNNHSDDLFMFMKKRVTGLLPATSYDFTIDVDIASCYPTNAVGVGGAPGEGVILKAGATTIEPMKIPVDSYFRMNIDKDNQGGAGADMDTIGHVGVSDTTTVYTMIRRTNGTHPFRVKSDADGSVWVCLGTESGFEATTTLYYDRISLAFSSTVGIDDPQTQPESFTLEQNYPNPFNPTTTIRFTIAGVVALSGSEGPATMVRLAVYDLLGREVAVLLDEQKAPGRYQVEFDGAKLSSGVYIYRLTGGNYVESKRMIVLR